MDKCPKCGNPVTKYQARCSFCGAELPPDMRPPSFFQDAPSKGEKPREKDKAVKIPQLQVCPECKQKSLFWNEYYGLYECLNRDCRKRFAKDGLTKEREEAAPEEPEDGLIKERQETAPKEYRRERAHLPEKVKQASSSRGEGKAWFGNEYFDPKHRKWKKPKSGGFSMKKFFLILLVIACLVAAAYTAYLLFTEQTDPLVGAIILVADIGVLIWNISVLRSYRVGYGSVFAVFLVTALVALTVCAFAGVAPFSEVKDKVVSFFTTETKDSQTPVPSSSSKPEINIQQLELQIHNLVNAERQKRGLKPLSWDDKLADIARKHSQDMAQNDFFSHINLRGQDPTERAKSSGYYCRKDFGSYYTEGIAENIFQGYLYSSVTYYGGIPSYDWNTQEEIAISAVSGWMNSPGHRQNILTATYDKEGIGIAISSDNKVLITQDFC